MIYTITDNREGSPTKGKSVDFDWHKDSTPTKDDLSRVIESAYGKPNTSAWGEKKPYFSKALTAGAKGVLGAAEMAGGLAKNFAMPEYEFDKKTGKPHVAGHHEEAGKNIDANLKVLHAHLDSYANSPDSQPEGLLQHLLYGMVEFAPSMPIFEIGSPVGKYIESGLETIAKKFTPEVAKQVAEKLPSVLASSLKYGKDVAEHAAGQYGTGFSMSLLANQGIEKANETGEGFAIASIGFKILQDAGVNVKKWAGKDPSKAEPTPKGEATPERGEPRFTDLPLKKPSFTAKEETPEQKVKSLERSIERYNQKITRLMKWINDKAGNEEHAAKLNTSEKNVVDQQQKELVDTQRKLQWAQKKVSQLRTGKAEPKQKNTPKQTTREKVANEIKGQESAEKGWEKAQGGPAEFRPSVHPDHFEGLEPSDAAKAKGKLVDRIDQTLENDRNRKIERLEGQQPRRPVADDPNEVPRGTKEWDQLSDAEKSAAWDEMEYENDRAEEERYTGVKPEWAEASLKARRADFQNRFKEHRKATRQPGEDAEEPIQYLHSMPFLYPKREKASLGSRLDRVKETSAYAAYKNIRQRLYEFTTTDSTPVGNRFGIGEHEVRHAASRISGRLRAEELLSRKWNFDIKLYDKEGNQTYEGPAYKSPEYLKTFELMRVRDNVLAGHDQTTENRALFEAKAQEAYSKQMQAEASLQTVSSEGYNLLGKDALIKKLKNQIKAAKRDVKDFSGKATKAKTEAENIKKAVDAKFVSEDNPEPDGLKIYDDFVQKQMQDTQMFQGMEAWLDPDDGIGSYLEDQWQAYKRLDGEGDTDYTRGRHTGIRAQLQAMDLIDLEQPLPETGKKESHWHEQEWNERQNINKDKHDQRAKFTGSYSTDLVTNLADVIGKRNDSITKAELYDTMIEKGVMTPHGERPPKEIQGEKAIPFHYEYPVTEKRVLDNGKEYHSTTMEGRVGYIPQFLERELKDALGMNPKAKPNMIGQFINSTQMAGILDAVIHGNNLTKTVAKSLGVSDSEAYELIRRLPFVGRVDAMARIGEVYKQVLSDSPEIRARRADLAERGLLRTSAHYQEALTRFVEGEGWLGKAGEKLPDNVKAALLSTEGAMNKMADFLFGVDTASRMILDDAFTEMAGKGRLKDTPENRRKWIEQVGQYNDRLMGPIQRAMRNWGLAPFVVAGRTMNRNATRALTGYSGAEAGSVQAEIKNRMLAYFGTATAALTPMIYNLVQWGNAFGPDGKAPLGTMVLTKKDEHGNRKMLNVFADSFLQRGLNLYGGDILQGELTGTSGVESNQAAIDKALSGRLHPWAGPFPQAASKMAGLDLTQVSNKSRRNYGHADDNLSDRAREVLADINPLLLGAVSNEPTKGDPGKALTSPFLQVIGYREGKTRSSTAEQMARQKAIGSLGQMSKEVAEEQKLKNDLRTELRKDFKGGLSKLIATPDEKLSPRKKENLLKSLNMTKLQHYFHDGKIELADAYDIFDKSDINERKELGAYLIQKVINRSEKAGVDSGAVVKEFKKRMERYKKEIPTYVQDYQKLMDENKIPEVESGKDD